jgi:hypothetical protein
LDKSSPPKLPSSHFFSFKDGLILRESYRHLGEPLAYDEIFRMNLPNGVASAVAPAMQPNTLYSKSSSGYYPNFCIFGISSKSTVRLSKEITGWFSSVYVQVGPHTSIEGVVGRTRDQLIKLKRSLGNQVRGLLRPFGIKLPSRAGGKKFYEAAYLAACDDPILHAAIRAPLESLASIEGQQALLDDELDELAKRNEIAWRLMSVPGVGRNTALAYIGAIENVERFRRTHDIGGSKLSGRSP